MASHATKRKRETNDLPMARNHPTMAMNDFDQHYLPTHGTSIDHDDMGFALPQHNTLDNDHDTQHAQGHGSRRSTVNDGSGASASDTAAAAMAQFHTMRVPQSTEAAFMSQVVDAAPTDRPNSASIDQGSLDAHRRTGSFDFDVSGLKDASAASNGEGSPTAPSQTPGGSSKPLVGTEEWHKVRKDNHKEGKPFRRSQS